MFVEGWITKHMQFVDAATHFGAKQWRRAQGWMDIRELGLRIHPSKSRKQKPLLLDHQNPRSVVKAHQPCWLSEFYLLCDEPTHFIDGSIPAAIIEPAPNSSNIAFSLAPVRILMVIAVKEHSGW
jgi:hypothetical protein